MKPDRLLNQLVVTSLTIFITLSILMGVILFRQIHVQQTVIETNEILQLTIEDLEETTQDLQEELLEIQSNDVPPLDSDSLDDVNGLLTDVDEQLDTIEQGIDDIGFVLDAQLVDETLSEDMPQNDIVLMDQADHLFSILAILVAITSIAVAILLGIAVRVQNNNSIQASQFH